MALTQLRASYTDLKKAFATSRGKTKDSVKLLKRSKSKSEPQLLSTVHKSLRNRASEFTDAAWLDIRTRADKFEFSVPNRFRFSLPLASTFLPFLLSDSERPDNEYCLTDSWDASSFTSLELESRQDGKRENNRLRAILDGLPSAKPLFPGDQSPSYAGLSRDTKALNIIVLGGYRGSTLHSRDDDRTLWIPISVTLGIRKVDLTIPLHKDAETEEQKRVYARNMLTNIGVIDMGRRLLKRLRQEEKRGFCRVHEYAYDWRLSGHLLSQQLIEFLDDMKGPKLVIAHSLGGLVVHHAVTQRPDLFTGVLYAGTPFGGCPNILGPFRYGDGVLLNKSVLNASTNFSMRSSFLLLPSHQRCFVDVDSGREIPLDFFNASIWREMGLSPVVSPLHGKTDVGQAGNLEGDFATGGMSGPKMSSSNCSRAPTGPNSFSAQSTNVVEDDAEAFSYLERTLKETAHFRKQLFFDSDTKYPPIAILRSQSTPTVRGAKVHGVGGIQEGDYNNFIMAPGDGVVLYASADIRSLNLVSTADVADKVRAKIQDFDKKTLGYTVCCDRENDRGHIGLLGDLRGVEDCIKALLESRNYD